MNTLFKAPLKKGAVDFETIQKHRTLVKEKGIKALGEEATSSALKTSITAIRLFSYLTVIFAIPVHFLTSLYYKKVAKQIIENDNISIIRSRCLFIPTENEKDYLQKSHLVSSGEFLDENQNTLDVISDAHLIYDFSRSFSNKSLTTLLETYLHHSQASHKEISEIRKLANSISKNNLSYQKIPSWFRNISVINKTLTVRTSSKTDREAIFEILNLITNCGKGLIRCDAKKIESFKLIANVYQQLIKQGFETDRAKTSSLLLLPLVIQLCNAGKENVAEAFTDAFTEDSFLRMEISDNQDEFIIQYKNHIKNRLTKLNTEEEIHRAVRDFRLEFNHPEHLNVELSKQLGGENAALTKGVLQNQDPDVAAREKSFEQSKLAEKPFTVQVRLLIPDIAKEFHLNPKVVNKVLITKDLSTENFDNKKELLKKLRTLFTATENSELIQECFLHSPEGFLQNIDDKKYWEDWSKAIAYAKRTYSPEEHSSPAVAKAISLIVYRLSQKNENKHRIAIEHLGHACDTWAALNRDRRDTIRQEIDTELALFTLQEKLKLVNAEEVAQTVADQYKLELELIRPYLHSPIAEDFVEQLRTLKLLSRHLPALVSNIKNKQLVHSLIKAYGPDLFTKNLTDSQNAPKLGKILSYAHDLSKKGVYSSTVIGKGLGKTLHKLQKEKEISSEKSLESCYQAAKSIIDNEQDEHVKCLLQEQLLHAEIAERIKAHVPSDKKTISRQSRRLMNQLLEHFVVHKELPKRATVEYIAESIMNTLSLQLNKEATDSAIALAFASNPLIKKNVRELDAIRHPAYLEAARKSVKDDAVNRDRMETTISIDQEKLLFPLLIELLPGFCRNMIPENRKSLQADIETKLERISRRFRSSKTLQLELKEAYRHVGLVYAWMNLGPNMLSPFLTTALDLVFKELKKAQDILEQLDGNDIDVETIRETLTTNESSVAMATFLPLAAEALTGVHDKYNKILQIKGCDVEPLLVIEGSDEEQRIDDYTNVVVLKPAESFLMDLFEKIPDTESNLIKLIEKAPSLLEAGGGVGNWFAKKIGTSLIKKQLSDNLGINQHHLHFLKSNIEDLLSIGLILAPFLMKRHNMKKYLGKTHAIKTLIISEKPLDQKELHLKLLELLQLGFTDLKTYQPIIMESVKHIHKNIS